MVSILLSVVLTVLLNVALRSFPGGGDRAARRLDELASRDPADGRRVRVWFPWRAMLLASVALTVVVTVVVNLVAWLA